MRGVKGLLCLALLMTLAAAAPQDKAQGELLHKIVAFCRDHKGQQVGRGECSDLAGAALKDAGAARRGKDDPGSGDYNWGKLILIVTGDETKSKFEQGKPADLRPGDVIQFRDAKFVHHESRRWSSLTFDHHTAIVASTEGNIVHIFQENFAGKRYVIDGTLRLDELKAGWLRFYEPTPKEDPDANADKPGQGT